MFGLIHNKFLGRYAKNWIFHQNNIFKVSAWLFNNAVCKIGLVVNLAGEQMSWFWTGKLYLVQLCRLITSVYALANDHD